MAFRDGHNFCKALCTCAPAKTLQKLSPSHTVMTQWGQDSPCLHSISQPCDFILIKDLTKLRELWLYFELKML